MKFFRALAEKPWLPQLAGSDKLLTEQHTDPRNTALSFFIAVVSVIFFLLTITFLSRTQFPDFQTLAGEPWQPLTGSVQLWLNTLFLGLASFSLHLTHKFADEGDNKALPWMLMLGFLFSAMFIAGQMLVWQQLVDLGYFISENPANSYYYLFTGIHAIHLMGGIAVLLQVSYRYIKKSDIDSLSASIKLCASYWHFLFIVWVLLFFLLTRSAATYNAIAVLCGFN